MTAQRRRLLADGFAAGVIGTALVVAFFAVLDLVAGRSPVYTAAVLGEAIFDGLQDPAAVTPAAGPILAVTGVHLAAYLLFGLFGAWLASQTERHPEFWALAVFLFLGATVVSYAGVLTAMALVGSPLSTGRVVAASLVGAVGVGVYLAASHRSVIQAIRAEETPLGRVE